ncbi:MAG: universal stress protein [Caldilineaceae bacterium]
MTIPYRKILVPLDGSAVADQALPHAQHLAVQSSAELILLEVVPELNSESKPKSDAHWELSNTEAQQNLVDKSAEALEVLADNLRFHQINVKAVVEVGEPASKIVEYAAAHDTDLIVMCTHGRTGLQRLAYGSTANQVLTTAPCPVLLVRSQLCL